MSTVAKVLALTCAEPPGETTHRTGRAMTGAVGPRCGRSARSEAHAGKNVTDRKIHTLVDTEGLPMRVIHSAATQDRNGVGLVLDKTRQDTTALPLARIDLGRWWLQWQVDCCGGVLPRRRVVEHAVSGYRRNR